MGVVGCGVGVVGCRSGCIRKSLINGLRKEWNQYVHAYYVFYTRTYIRTYICECV